MQWSAARYKRAHVPLFHTHKLDNMDQVQLDFTLNYLKKNPSASREEINAAYLQSQQGKQAMNTRLLGG